MSKLGFLYTDHNKDGINLISFIGPEETIVNSLYVLFGNFPLIYRGDDGIPYAILLNNNQENESINNQLGSKCKGRIDHVEDLLVKSSNQYSLEDIEMNDLVYDAREDESSDVDVDDLSDWVIVDLEVPSDLYTKESFDKLNGVLESIKDSQNLKFIQD